LTQILAADIGGTVLKVGLVEEHKVSDFKKIPSRASEGKEALLQTLLGAFSSFKNAGIGGIGVSTAGSVDVKTGTIYYATNAIPGWAGTKLKEWLEEQYHLPAFVENDGRAAATAEMVYGLDRNTKNFVFITIGTGLGGAVILKREIADFSESVRPEGLGHFLLELEGLTCSCGKQGCWEAQASLTGLRKKFEKLCSSEEKEWDVKKIFDMGELGHERALEAVESFFRDLGRGLAVLNSHYHPEKFILGGAVSERGEKFISAVQQSLKNFDPAWDGEIAASAMGNDAGMLGVAYLTKQMIQKKTKPYLTFLDSLLDDPVDGLFHRRIFFFHQ
jgi:predicted NBD/HSP70 family sugar kinase